MQSDDYSKAITYVGKKPDIDVLIKAYQTTTNELESYYDLCRT